MVSVLEWAKDGNSVDRLTVGSMTKLTLATNASRDKNLLDMLKASMAHENKETRAVLREVIDAAETFEFGEVRRDAMASIDQLKVKGPASTRNAHVVGSGRPDRAGARLHRRRRHGPFRSGHPLRRRRRGIGRGTQVHGARAAISTADVCGAAPCLTSCWWAGWLRAGT